MRRLSIRFKITMWFTAALVIVVLFTYFIVFHIHNQLIQKTIRDSLIETVEDNVDEVEFYTNIDNVDVYHETDYYIVYHNGYLQIDDDYLDNVNEIYTALYDIDATLLYGENPVSRATARVEFADSKIRQVTVNDILYYVYDRRLEAEGLKGLWLRGIVSENQGNVQMSEVVRQSLVFLPLLVLISIIGGYLLTKRTLSPIQKISELATKIRTSGDLSKRIEIGTGKDELHQLAESFNGMFRRLEESFDAERQFTSDASHELRTPVSVISAQCEFSLEKTRSAKEYEHALQTIRRQSRKMTKLINDMLDFTRLEMRAESYMREQIDMTELVSSICSDMALIKEKNITLNYETENNVTFYGNRQLLSRLLANLISNAYRYGKEDGHIFVSLKSREQGMELAVSDDGTGIAKEEQSKIFQRFYQADNSHSGEGTGLGLSMVSKIMQFHGGEIKVESELGKGSTFLMLF